MPLSPVNLCPIYRHNLNCTTQFRHFATETSLARRSQSAACVAGQCEAEYRIARDQSGGMKSLKALAGWSAYPRRVSVTLLLVGHVPLPDLSRCSKTEKTQSISASARASSVAGTVRPSAVARRQLFPHKQSCLTSD